MGTTIQNRINSKKGGRPKGSKAAHTIEAETARRYLVQRVVDELDPIIEKYLKLARNGDRHALEYLMNQVAGKPRETFEVQTSHRLLIDV